MTPQERITRHEATIDQIRQEIAWLEEYRFEFPSGPDGRSGTTTADLVAQQQKLIEMYEGFITKLRERIANA